MQDENQIPTEAKRHRAVEQVLQYFKWDHLPEHLQQVSKPVGELAYGMADGLPPSPEVTVGLRKLLEAKDCFVRAALSSSSRE